MGGGRASPHLVHPGRPVRADRRHQNPHSWQKPSSLSSEHRRTTLKSDMKWKPATIHFNSLGKEERRCRGQSPLEQTPRPGALPRLQELLPPHVPQTPRIQLWDAAPQGLLVKARSCIPHGGILLLNNISYNFPPQPAHQPKHGLDPRHFHCWFLSGTDLGRMKG